MRVYRVVWLLSDGINMILHKEICIALGIGTTLYFFFILERPDMYRNTILVCPWVFRGQIRCRMKIHWFPIEPDNPSLYIFAPLGPPVDSFYVLKID